MKVTIFDDMTLCTEAEVQRMLTLVPEWRREQALRFRHTFGQFACLKSFLILCEMLNVPGEMLQDIPFIYSENGKPSLDSGLWTLDFNISHCRRAIAVAVSDTPIGIDIESVRDISDALVEKTMNADEQRQIREADNPAFEFTALWTRKEAVLKREGTGITDDLRDVLCGETRIETHVCADKQYIWSVAY